ncbi:MAG: PQQ-binding-like beta-propeller repeat protein [Phycisphaeraceae bacterium]
MPEPVEPLWRLKNAFTAKRAIQPVSAEVAGDVRTYHFKESIDLGSVILTEREGARIEEARVSFSDDDFKSDVRSTEEFDRGERIIGPDGKSFFHTHSLLTARGQKARSVRVQVMKQKRERGDALEEVEFLSAETRPELIQKMQAVGFGQGGPSFLVQYGSHSIVAVSGEGKELWRRRFDTHLLTWEVLEWKGAPHLVAMDAAGRLNFVDAGGQVVESITLSAKEPKLGNEFFRNNRAYSLGQWPEKDGPPSIVMGTYQSVAWVRPDGTIEAWPANPTTLHLNFLYGYMWRGLQYFDLCLPRAEDLNDDGVMDQVFLSRGFAQAPRLMFFDGKTGDAWTEHRLPAGRAVGLMRVARGDDTKGFFVVNEFHAGMYDTNGAVLWKADLDLPASACAAWAGTNEFRYAIGNREGMVIVLGQQGELKYKTGLAGPITAIRPITADGAQLLVAHGRGLSLIDTDQGKQLWTRGPAATLLAQSAGGPMVAATDQGDLIAFEPQDIPLQQANPDQHP